MARGGRTNILCANKITFSFADGLALLSSPLCWRKRTLLSLTGDRRFISNDAPFVYWTKTINEPKRLSRSARIMLISKRDPLNAGRLLALLCSSPTTNTDFGWLRAGKIGLESADARAFGPRRYGIPQNQGLSHRVLRTQRQNGGNPKPHLDVKRELCSYVVPKT